MAHSKLLIASKDSYSKRQKLITKELIFLHSALWSSLMSHLEPGWSVFSQGCRGFPWPHLNLTATGFQPSSHPCHMHNPEEHQFRYLQVSTDWLYFSQTWPFFIKVLVFHTNWMNLGLLFCYLVTSVWKAKLCKHNSWIETCPKNFKPWVCFLKWVRTVILTIKRLACRLQNPALM